MSDRFHILKNLTSYATDALKRELKHKVPLKTRSAEHSSDSTQKLESMNRKLTFEEKGKEALELMSKGVSKTLVSK